MFFSVFKVLAVSVCKATEYNSPAVKGDSGAGHQGFLGWLLAGPPGAEGSASFRDLLALQRIKLSSDLSDGAGRCARPIHHHRSPGAAFFDGWHF